MTKPRLLDLFCGAGGAAMGYSRAGFQIVGVDLYPQPNYPFEFHQADALTYPLDGFHFIHTSPPCQGYTALKAVHGNKHPLLIPAMRKRLRDSGIPSLIENVPGAPIRRDLMLCGEMFQLAVLRHRYFEMCNMEFRRQPAHPRHRGRVAGMRHGEWFQGPYFAVYGEGGGKGTVAQWQQAMGIDWMTERRELAEAIPPAYTQYIGEQLMSALGGTHDDQVA